jgi:hypothetical protein
MNRWRVGEDRGSKEKDRCPLTVNTGRNPRMGFEPQQPHSTLESANEFAERIALGIEEAKAALTKAKDEYTMYYNLTRARPSICTRGQSLVRWKRHRHQPTVV